MKLRKTLLVRPEAKAGIIVLVSVALAYSVAQQAPQPDTVAAPQSNAPSDPAPGSIVAKPITSDTPWDDPVIASRTPEQQWVMYQILHPREAQAAREAAFPLTPVEKAAREAAIFAITQPEVYNAAVNASKTPAQLQDEERARQSISNPVKQ